MRIFTAGEQSIINKVDNGDWIRGFFYIEIAQNLVFEGLLEHVQNGSKMSLYEKQRFRRVK